MVVPISMICYKHKETLKILLEKTIKFQNNKLACPVVLMGSQKLLRIAYNEDQNLEYVVDQKTTNNQLKTILRTSNANLAIREFYNEN